MINNESPTKYESLSMSTPPLQQKDNDNIEQCEKELYQQSVEEQQEEEKEQESKEEEKEEKKEFNNIINNSDNNNNNNNDNYEEQQPPPPLLPPPPKPTSLITSTTTSTLNTSNENNIIKDDDDIILIIDGTSNDEDQSTERYIEDLNDFVKITPPYIEEDEEQQENNTLLTTTTTTTTTISENGTKSTVVTNLFSKAANTITSINNFIKYSIISEETEEALGHINSLLNQLFQNVPYSKLQIMLGLSLLDSYYSNSHITTGSFVSDREFIDRASYYMRFASATFGWKYIYGYLYKKKAKGFVQGVAQGDALNDQVLCEYTGIAKDDIILTKWTSTNYDPGHYLCYDHKNRSVVFSIRGTFGARDILTDLVANQSPFLDGKAHTGMLRCAQKKFQELTPLILSSLKKYEGYGFIVVGHSLGAGVASLFSILFKNSYPDIPIHCYSFATPCVTSSEIALSIEYRPLIDTFVFNDDIVPRLCYASLEHLKTLVCSILEQNDSVFNLIFQTISAGNQLGEGLTNRMDSFLKYKRDIKLKYEELKLTGDSMLPPGKVYRIYKPDNVNYVMEESNPSFFKEIIISNTLISDHMPDKYEEAFKWCSDNLNSINPFVDLDKEDLIILGSNQELEQDIEHQLENQLHQFEKQLFLNNNGELNNDNITSPPTITNINSTELKNNDTSSTIENSIDPLKITLVKDNDNIIPLTTTISNNSNNTNNINTTTNTSTTTSTTTTTQPSIFEKIWNNNLF